MYINPSDKALRLSIDFVELCKILEDFANKNDCKVYIGNVIYELRKDEITSLHKKISSSYYNDFFPTPFSLENYLSLMLIKRNAFEFENEVRIFIVKDNLFPLISSDLLRIKNVNYSKELIPLVMIAPYEPLPEYDIRTPFRKKINNIESSEYKKIISSLFGGKVNQSQLYSVKTCKPLIKM
jgi:hypothetical protein